MSDESMFDAIELNLQLSTPQRTAVMERLHQTGHVNPDGTVSRHYWIQFAKDELRKGVGGSLAGGEQDTAKP